MDDVSLRLVVTGAVVGLALLGAGIARRVRARRMAGTPVDVRGLGPFPAMLLFTSPDCVRCDRARTTARRALGDRWREIDYAHDRIAFAASRVAAVPLMVAVDEAGRVVDTVGGAPSARRMRVAARRAGV